MSDNQNVGVSGPREREAVVTLCVAPRLGDQLELWLARDGYRARRTSRFPDLVLALAAEASCALCFELAVAADGVESLRRIARSHRRLPIVALVGSEDEAAAAMKAGAFCTLTRPVDAHHFLSAVQHAVEHRSLSRRLRRLERELEDSVSTFFSGRTLEQVERHAIEEALRRTGNNISAACRQLGIGRTTIYRKLAKYGQ